MLSLSQKFSLNTIRTVTDSWTPTPGQDNMIAWWRKGVDVTMAAGLPYGVDRWLDQSGNNYHMQQPTLVERPEGAGNIGQNNGEVWFDPTASQNMDIAQITVSGDFTIAMKIKVFNVGGCLLSDNDDVGEFMKLTSTIQLRMKFNNGGALNVALDSGIWTDAETRLIVTRESGTIKMWRNGVLMSGSATSAEDFKIDNFGIRRTDLNPFDGWLSDCSIYNETNATLTTDLDNYLQTI